jgi:hypothetical protein
VLATLLYGVPVTDLAVFVGIPLLLGVVAIGASWVPALRAARINPLVAMRADRPGCHCEGAKRRGSPRRRFAANGIR